MQQSGQHAGAVRAAPGSQGAAGGGDRARGIGAGAQGGPICGERACPLPACLPTCLQLRTSCWVLQGQRTSVQQKAWYSGTPSSPGSGMLAADEAPAAPARSHSRLLGGAAGATAAAGSEHGGLASGPIGAAHSSSGAATPAAAAPALQPSYCPATTSGRVGTAAAPLGEGAAAFHRMRPPQPAAAVPTVQPAAAVLPLQQRPTPSPVAAASATVQSGQLQVRGARRGMQGVVVGDSPCLGGEVGGCERILLASGH